MLLSQAPCQILSDAVFTSASLSGVVTLRLTGVAASLSQSVVGTNHCPLNCKIIMIVKTLKLLILIKMMTAHGDNSTGYKDDNTAKQMFIPFACGRAWLYTVESYPCERSIHAHCPVFNACSDWRSSRTTWPLPHPLRVSSPFFLPPSPPLFLNTKLPVICLPGCSRASFCFFVFLLVVSVCSSSYSTLFFKLPCFVLLFVFVLLFSSTFPLSVRLFFRSHEYQLVTLLLPVVVCLFVCLLLVVFCLVFLVFLLAA